MTDSIFIKALYFGKEHPNGFTIPDLENHLGVPESKWGPLQREFQGQKPDNAFNQSDSRDGKELYWLTKSGHQLLAELDDVRQAREQSREARNLAIISIIVAAVVPIIIKLLDIFVLKGTTT